MGGNVWRAHDQGFVFRPSRKTRVTRKYREIGKEDLTARMLLRLCAFNLHVGYLLMLCVRKAGEPEA